MKFVALKDVCRITNGGTPKSDVESLWHGGIAWLTPAEMGKRLTPYFDQTIRTISAEGLANSSAKLVQPNSVILSTRAPIGHLAINQVPMAFNQGCRGLTPSDKLDTKFLYHFLYFSREVLDGLGTGTTFKELSSSSLANFQIPLPPLEEQQRIVAVLDKAFAGIATATANAQKNLTNARSLFEGYLESIFRKNDGSWESGSLKNIGGVVSTGPFGSLLHKSDYVENVIPLVNPAHINGERIEPDYRKSISMKTLSRLSAYVLAENDIVIGRRGEIGRCAVVTDVESGWLCGTGCFFIRPNKSVNAHFLAHLLRSRPYRGALESMATGATMLNLSNTALGDLNIALPSLACQNAYVSNLNQFSSLVSKVQVRVTAKLAALTELKQSLLQKAFAGELT